MFDVLRRMIVPIIIIVLLFFGGMIVLEWGLGLSNRQQFVDSNIAGVVNGEKVSWQTYNNLLNNMIQAEQQDSDEELPDQRVRELQLEAWKQVVHDQLMLQQVRKMDIVVTDEELYSYLRYSPPPELRTLPYFQTEGQFDPQKYMQAMQDPQAAGFWRQIEAAAREDIARMKVQELVLQAAHVTEDEVREWFLGKNEKVKVGMVTVDFARFSRPAPSSTEEELKAYYEENLDEYGIDERASLNLVLVEKKPAPSDWEIAFEKASAIYDSILAGADFAEMAETYSDDPGSAENGGDLGWFPRGQMVSEFDRYAFQMNPGQVFEPIRTQFGWHIIKLHDKKTEERKAAGSSEMKEVEMAHASHILVEAKPSRETLDQLYTRMEEFRSDARQEGFFKAAEDHQLPVRTTGFFFRGRNIQYLGNDPNAGLFAFNEDIDAISEVFENNSAFYVVQASERKPAGQATFEEARQAVELDLQQHKVATLCMDTAQAIYEEIMDGVDIKRAAERHGEEYATPEPFTRSSYVEGIRRDPMAVGAAFALDNPGEVSPPVEYKQGVVIYRLIEKITPDMSEFAAARDSIHNVILMTKRRDMYNQWVDYMVGKSEIENYVQDFLDQQRAGQAALP